jgi:hypothetical protein
MLLVDAAQMRATASEGSMSRHAKVVSELKATNWILERWAISVGDGLYDAPWDDVPQSRVPPLNDQMAIVVDQLVIRSGDKTRRLVGYWYRTPLAKSVIAEKLGCSRDTIYVRWNAALWYFRDRFLESPLSDLRLIARTDVCEAPTATRQIPTVGVASFPTFRSTLGANCGNCLNVIERERELA